jgi:Zn-dependent M28 family amino/carboxypeptidase
METGDGDGGDDRDGAEPGPGPHERAGDESGGATVGGVDAAAIGRATLDVEPWALLGELTGLGSRMAGSEGERRTADLLADRLAAAGARAVRREPFSMPVWTRGETDLTVLAPDERPFEAIALPYSPAGTVTGPLVDVGYGTPEEVDAADVAGAVAVASTTTPPGERFVHRMEKYGHAVDAGAAGFVFVNHVTGQLPPTGSLRVDGEAPVPAVGVSAETGEWLREYADREGRLRYEVAATTAPGESGNVRGRVPATGERDGGSGGAEPDSPAGSGSGDGTGDVLLVAHYDAHDVGEGALDNGCGVAVVATAVRLLAAPETHLANGVRVAFLGAEEAGLVGAERLAERLDPDAVRAVVNVDGAGRNRDPIALTHASAATGAAVERVSDRTRQPVQVDDRPHPFSDHWPFVRRGVPAVQFHSDSGERGRGWTHTRADTRDKIDDRDVREHAVLVALVVAELARTDRADLPRLSGRELRAAFREESFEPGMRAAGMWPDAWADNDGAIDGEDRG